MFNMFQAALGEIKKKKTNLTETKERHLTFPRVMHSETSQVEKLFFIIYNLKKKHSCRSSMSEYFAG